MTYRNKHNEANGENNHDGTNADYSDNYGIEGETDNPIVNAVRTRQVKNMLLTLFVSRGVPMLLGGDEFGRTQRGNNNAYCQDNETSWFDWRRTDQYSDILKFTRDMIAFRRAHPLLSAEHFYNDLECHWLGPQGGSPGWRDSWAKQFGWLIHEDPAHAMYLMFNAGNEAMDFQLPPAPPESEWRVAIDTSGTTTPQTTNTHRLLPKSAAIAVNVTKQSP